MREGRALDSWLTNGVRVEEEFFLLRDFRSQEAGFLVLLYLSVPRPFQFLARVLLELGLSALRLFALSLLPVLIRIVAWLERMRSLLHEQMRLRV